ncbi:MAG: class I SAM-dependent methyltransferase [Deltaproteobacteria bacterium]|nr:class I SAM-dependent methyltransferase [Deltaproteobacteria bacterium]
MTNNPQTTVSFDKKPPVKVEEYDKSIRLFCAAYEEMFRISHSCLRARIQKDAKLLIVGAGTGMEVCEFGPLNPGWSFCGVDPSEDMLKLATKNISKNNLTNQIELKKGYVDDLEDSEVFDGATCILVMHFLKDDGGKLALLKSICKRLKRGTPFLLIDGHGQPGSMEFEEIKASWKQYPIIQGVQIESMENAFEEVIMKMIRFVPESRILELLSTAGFTGMFKFYSGFLYGGWIGYKA